VKSSCAREAQQPCWSNVKPPLELLGNEDVRTSAGTAQRTE
jgi:hypothetical protein